MSSHYYRLCSKWLYFNAVWPSTLLVRDIYEIFLSKIEAIKKSNADAKCHSFLVTGNPGIGKTCFLLYYILRLFNSSEDTKPKIFYSNSAANKYFFIDVAAKTVTKLYYGTFADYRSVNNDWSNCYYFFDCSPNVKMIDMDLAMKCCVTVLVSSPNTENYKLSEKSLITPFFTYTTLYMPIWSFDEIEALNVLPPPFFPCSQEDLKTRFHKYGGCIRSILRPDDNKLENTLKREFRKTIESAEALSGDVGWDKDSSHQVFVMTPYPDDYTSYTFDFISDYVRKKMYENGLTSTKMKLIDFIADIKGVSLAAGLRGSLFEMYSHDQLVSKQTKYKLRNLRSKEETDFLVSAQKLEVYNKLDDPKTYYVPKARNNPAYDSHHSDCAFQMTVSYNHPVKYYPLLQLKNRLNIAKLQLIFVVPEDIYPDFTLQIYTTVKGDGKSRNVKDMEQFALCMNLVSF